MQAAHQQLKDGTDVIGVISGPDSAVDEDALFARIASMGLTYDQVRDRDLELTHLFGVSGTPTVIILDSNGKVLFNEHHVPQTWEALR